MTLYIAGDKAATWRVGGRCLIRIIRADPLVGDSSSSCFADYPDEKLLKYVRKHHDIKDLIAMLAALAEESEDGR